MIELKEIKDGKQAVYAKDRNDWRNWLQENCLKEHSVWLILFHKKSKTPSVSMDEATEEALCFGWIDSLCKKRNEESYYLTYSRRNPKKSNWSKLNIERAERLIQEGRMTEYGLQLIEIARQTGKWNR
jgi:uncharacterized protein YdeI (YjbR/CyaY-like superfamily)